MADHDEKEQTRLQSGNVELKNQQDAQNKKAVQDEMTRNKQASSSATPPSAEKKNEKEPDPARAQYDNMKKTFDQMSERIGERNKQTPAANELSGWARAVMSMVEPMFNKVVSGIGNGIKYGLQSSSILAPFLSWKGSTPEERHLYRNLALNSARMAAGFSPRQFDSFDEWKSKFGVDSSNKPPAEKESPHDEENKSQNFSNDKEVSKETDNVDEASNRVTSAPAVEASFSNKVVREPPDPDPAPLNPLPDADVRSKPSAAVEVEAGVMGVLSQEPQSEPAPASNPAPAPVELQQNNDKEDEDNRYRPGMP